MVGNMFFLAVDAIFLATGSSKAVTQTRVPCANASVSDPQWSCGSNPTQSSPIVPTSSLGSRICRYGRGKGQHMCRKMFDGGSRTVQRRVPRSMALETLLSEEWDNATYSGLCEPASRKEQTLPSCVGGVHRAPHHRISRGAARRHQRDRRHFHGNPDCPVRFGTHDGRVVHSARLRSYTLHRAIFAWVDVILQRLLWI